MFRKHDVVESKIGGVAFVREDQGKSDQVICISVGDEGDTHSNKWPAAALTKISDVREAPMVGSRKPALGLRIFGMPRRSLVFADFGQGISIGNPRVALWNLGTVTRAEGDRLSARW